MYRVTTDEQSESQIASLPPAALSAFAEARAMLEVAPWGGDPLRKQAPDRPVRMVAFGPSKQGLITYLVLDDQRRVDVLDVFWLA